MLPAWTNRGVKGCQTFLLEAYGLIWDLGKLILPVCICLGVDLEPDEWIKDSGCSKHMTGNRKLFSTYKAYNGGNVIFGSNLRGNIIGKGQICDNKCKVTFSEHDSEITKNGKVIAHVSHKAKNIVSTTRYLELLHMDLFGPSAVKSYGGNHYTLVIVDDYFRKIKESLNVTFDETPPPSKTSPLVDDDLDEEETIMEIEKKNLKNIVEDETLEIDKIVNIKESMNHPLENVIRNLNQRTLRSQAQNQSNFYCFISTIELKNVNKALEDESWIVAMQEELNQFTANDFEMSMMGELNFFLGLQIKQMEDGIFFNQSKYIKEMLKKFGLEDSKPMKTPMSSDTKLTKDEECESVDSTKYRGMIGEMNLEDELRYTKSYIPTISDENYIPDILKPIIRNLECRSIHEGRPISPESTKYDNIQTLFQIIKLVKYMNSMKEFVQDFYLNFIPQ
ncbi:copia protein [Tanacetum coccineum]